MPPATRSEKDAVARLCVNCGLCCNGVLFGDVALQRGDDARRLASLGLSLERKGRTKCFPQPCSCFDGVNCRIYSERPAYCRAFECRLLQRVSNGSVSTKSAFASITQARQHVGELRQLLEALGHTAELPLSSRCAEIMAEPFDLAGDPKTIRLRSQLLRTVHDLMRVLERDFL